MDVEYLVADILDLALHRTAGVVQWGLRGRPLAEKSEAFGGSLAMGSNAISMIACGSNRVLWSGSTSSSF